MSLFLHQKRQIIHYHHTYLIHIHFKDKILDSHLHELVVRFSAVKYNVAGINFLKIC